MGDYRVTEGEPHPEPARKRRRTLVRRLAAAGAMAAAAIVLGAVVRVPRDIDARGYVTTDRYAELSPSAEGVVRDIRVGSGDRVDEGQVLVQLDAGEQQARLDEAEAAVRRAEAELVRREVEIAEGRRVRAHAEIVARLRGRHAAARLEQVQRLYEKGLASGQALEDARLNEGLATAELESLRRRGDTLDEKTLDVLRREVERLQEVVARAEAQLESRRIRAPFAGVVQRYEFVRGELVRPDMVLYQLFGGEADVVKLRVPERYAALVDVGCPVRLRLLPFGGIRRVRFEGTVIETRGVIQSQERQTYRLVTCRFDRNGRTVQPGTTAEAEVRVGRSSAWMALFGIF